MLKIISDNQIEIYLPNSEAAINLQHNGLKDRSVGMFYMSEQYEGVKEFLNNFDGKFYVDLYRTYNFINPLVVKLHNLHFETFFKDGLKSIDETLIDIKKLIRLDSDFNKIPAPFVNDNKKYLQFDFNSLFFGFIRNVCLGDLTCIVIKKIDFDVFVIYAKDANSFDVICSTKKYLLWK